MPPLILIMLGVLGGSALLRLATKESRRINQELEKQRQRAAADPTGVVTLRRDPATGTYRPG